MKIKKFVALLLVLLLCIGIFPVSAFADDNEENVVAIEETTEQIIEEVKSNESEESLWWSPCQDHSLRKMREHRRRQF